MTKRQDPKKTVLDGSSEEVDRIRATRQEQPKPPKEKKTPVSVYLDKDARAELDRLAKSLGVSRHSLLQFGVLYFLKAYKENPDILQTKKTAELIKP